MGGFTAFLDRVVLTCFLVNLRVFNVRGLCAPSAVPSMQYLLFCRFCHLCPAVIALEGGGDDSTRA